MPIAISARYLDIDFPNGLSLDQKIEIFGDRIIGWQLNPAQKLIEIDPNSGFAVLHILMSYFETVAKFRDGYCDDRDSSEYFKKGFKSFLDSLQLTPSNDALLSLFSEDRFYSHIYRQVRCGLYHSAMTGIGIFVTGEINSVIKVALTTNGDFTVEINPKQLVGAIQEHLKTYLRELRNSENVQLRRNFEARFDWIK